MDPAILQGRLEATCQAFEALERQLADPSVAGDPAQLQTLARERARLEPIVHDTHQLQRLEREQRETQELLRQPRGSADEEELAALAAEELQLLEERLDVLRQRLTVALLPRDPRDERSVMLEIRAGAGGDEAALWAGDLARMYERYAMAHGWQVQPLSASEAELGGFKELILSIKGDAVYSRLKFEAGVHRVQRVPATESQGGCTPPRPRWP
jgi:peptide chain release factor 1